MSNTANTLSNHVSELLARRISDGNWPVGQQNPPEVELSLIYKCSRTTIRRALNKLEKAGMISRRPKIGTVVISKGPGVSFSYSLSNFDDINQLGQSHRRQILEVAPFVADRLFASTFSVSEGSEFLRFSDVRLGMGKNDPPIVFTYVYVPSIYHGDVEKAKREPTRLMVLLLEELTGKVLQEVEQHIYAAPMPEEIAKHLNTPAGVPALRIIRHYREKEGIRLMLSESWHPGNRYGFHITISRHEAI